MLYTNYKQVARLVLKSEEADSYLYGPNRTLFGSLKTICTLYTFKPNLPFYKFTKNTRLAVESFTFIGTSAPLWKYTGEVIIKNFKKSNIYNSSLIQQGTTIFSGFMQTFIDYRNSDIINNSIDITGATDFLNGNELDIYVNSRLSDDAGAIVNGCVSTTNWNLTLVIFEQEEEENPKDYVDDRVKNHSIPALY